MSQQNKVETDASITVMLCVALFILFVVVLWYRFHTEFSQFFIFVQNIYNWPLFQIQYFFNTKLGINIEALDFMLVSTKKLCVSGDTLNTITSCTRDAATVKYLEILESGIVWNAIYGFFAIAIAFVGYRRIERDHPQIRFGKNHSLDSFMEEQKQNYSHLKLFTDFNLQMVNQNEGPFMGMKTAQEFAIENKLIDGYKKRAIVTIDNSVTKSQEDDVEKVPLVNRDALINILRGQLGSLWVGVDYITDAEAILLAMYLPRACSVDPKMHDKEFAAIWKECNRLEEEYWDTATKDVFESEKFTPIGEYADGTPIYPDGKKDFNAFNISKLKATIKEYIDYPIAKELLSKHAYTRTFIIAVIYQARRLGVMAPCQMRWLKFYDREMWALLQNVGRPSFYCENMGAISHYQAEFVAKTGIFQPHFDIAIRGFEHQLQSYLYEEDFLEQETVRNSSKRRKDSLYSANNQTQTAN